MSLTIAVYAVKLSFRVMNSRMFRRESLRRKQTFSYSRNSLPFTEPEGS
jgi:hypothetical protein